jgi:hypothetical protein
MMYVDQVQKNFKEDTQQPTLDQLPTLKNRKLSGMLSKKLHLPMQSHFP